MMAQGVIAEASPSEVKRPNGTPEFISVVVLVSERPAVLTELYHEYSAALRELGWPFEFIFVLDARWRHLAGSVAELAHSGEPVRIFEMAHNVGETTLLKQARAEAKGTILLTLPPYWRVVPEVLPRLVERVAEGADLVVARRWPRRDALVNRAQNIALHALMRPLLGRGIHDVACGVRAMRPKVIEEGTMYGDFLRFLPYMARRQGFQVAEIAGAQHSGDVKTRVYAPRTYLSRLLDVLALFVLLRFAEKPLRFFGTVGSLCSLSGLVLLIVILTDKISGQAIANRPLLLLAGMLVVIGIEAIALGLIGELIVYLYTRYVGRKPVYRIREHSSEP